MPAPRGATRSHRKGHYSCDFCRSRKLRCDRPLPCTNCVSRGKTCLFEPPAGEEQCRQQRRRQGQAVSNVTPRESPSQQLPTPVGTVADQESLLAEIRTLKELAKDLERRVANQTNTVPSCRNENFASLPTSTSTSTSPTGFASQHSDTDASDLGPISDVVAHLERVSMGQVSYDPIQVDEFMVKVKRVRAIPKTHTYTPHCVVIPPYNEARVLLDKFITSVSYIHHVVHHPSLPGIVEDIHRQLDSQEHVEPGHLVLLLSIIANATHIWGLGDGVSTENNLFASPNQANEQTSFWIKSAYDVLNSGRAGPPLSLESIQGIIILSFLVCNLEGVSLRYRSLISTGLLLSREMGLHRTDYDSNTPAPNTIRVEMGRRVWWYLAATDWFLAARYGRAGEGIYQVNPLHMRVRKPRNINDVDLIDGGLNIDLPTTQLTEMSYFLQRIRLAEISRSYVDQQHHQVAGSALHRGIDVMYMNAQLEEMVHDMPSFFCMESYEPGSDSSSSVAFVQAYMINSIMHTQRCKLHLSYLTSKPKDDGLYPSSRRMCLESAGQIIRGELQLENSQHPFVHVRRRLSGLLHGVFMAAIVLLLDDCVNGRLKQDGSRYGEQTTEALRIIDAAREQSLAAENLHKSLMQVLAKHCNEQKDQQTSAKSLMTLDASTPMESTMSAPLPQVSELPLCESHSVSATESDFRQQPHEGAAVSVSERGLDDAEGQVSDYYDPLVQSLGGLMDLDGFPWDDIFSDMSSASMF